jgi:N-methylhydantoinase A
MIRVDVGGTFTEILLEQSGQKGASGFVVAEVSSTPHDQSEAVVEASVCGLAGIEPDAIDAVFHGTTVATNGDRPRRRRGRHDHDARLRDILHMARHRRPRNFSLQFDVPWQSKPLIKRRNHCPPTGEIAIPLAVDEVRQAAGLSPSAAWRSSWRSCFPSSTTMDEQRARRSSSRSCRI